MTFRAVPLSPGRTTKAITLSELMALGSEMRVEVWDGEVREMSPVGGLHQVIASNLGYLLMHYVRQHQSGVVFTDGLLYLMGSSSRKLKHSFVPDLSFIHRDDLVPNWKLSKPYPGVPSLAIEIMSPDDTAEMIQKKARVYLEKGTREVWVVYPEAGELHQFKQTMPQTVRVYQRDEQVDVEALFPGLILKLDEIFQLPAGLA